MQRILPDPITEAVDNAAQALKTIDLRKVKGDKRERLWEAREAVAEAQKALRG